MSVSVFNSILFTPILLSLSVSSVVKCQVDASAPYTTSALRQDGVSMIGTAYLTRTDTDKQKRSAPEIVSPCLFISCVCIFVSTFC